MKALCCTQCGDIIIKSTDDDVKVRSKVLVFKSNGTFAICKGCGEEIPVPVIIDNSMMKSIATSKKLRLFIKSEK